MAVPFSKPNYNRNRRDPEGTSSNQDSARTRLVSRLISSSSLFWANIESTSFKSRLCIYVLTELCHMLKKVSGHPDVNDGVDGSPRGDERSNIVNEESPRPDLLPSFDKNQSLPDLIPAEKESSEDQTAPANENVKEIGPRAVGKFLYEVASNFEMSYGVDDEQRDLYEAYRRIRMELLKNDLKNSEAPSSSQCSALVTYSRTIVRQLLLSCLWALLKKLL